MVDKDKTVDDLELKTEAREETGASSRLVFMLSSLASMAMWGSSSLIISKLTESVSLPHAVNTGQPNMKNPPVASTVKSLVPAGADAGTVTFIVTVCVTGNAPMQLLGLKETVVPVKGKVEGTSAQAPKRT